MVDIKTSGESLTIHLAESKGKVIFHIRNYPTSSKLVAHYARNEDLFEDALLNHLLEGNSYWDTIESKIKELCEQLEINVDSKSLNEAVVQWLDTFFREYWLS